MFLTPQTFTFIILVLVIWLLVLSYITYNIVSHYRKLTKGAKNENFPKILENILEKQESYGKSLVQVNNQQAKLAKNSISYFQKHALIRFNPFEDAGGDQSFTIALLDGNNNGVVISSLHSRGGTRIYAKSVTQKRASSHQFSKEENEAVEKAAHTI